MSANPSKQPFNVTARPASRAARTQKQARNKANRATRANLNQDFQGPNNWSNTQKLAEYHATLNNFKGG